MTRNVTSITSHTAVLNTVKHVSLVKLVKDKQLYRRYIAKFHRSPQRHETRIKSVKDRQLDDSPRDVKVALMTSLDHTQTRRMKRDVTWYLCHLANKDVAHCRHLIPANSQAVVTPSHVIDDVMAPAAHKRLPSGDGAAAIMSLCRSQVAAGGNHQSACLNRYLKIFARRITTSGNKFVGR